MTDLVTKSYLHDQLLMLEQRLTIKLGVMLTVAVGVMATLIKIL
jgi:hypothetical protein